MPGTATASSASTAAIWPQTAARPSLRVPGRAVRAPDRAGGSGKTEDLIRANADLIAREHGLPGLTLMLDPLRLADTLGCGPLRLDYLRLKSGTNCVAA